MPEMQILSVQKRYESGKGSNRRLRTKNLVPGIFYNAKGDNIPVQMPELPLEKLYGQVSRTNIFNLEIEDNGKKTIYPAFVWDAQYHPVKNTFTHIDFLGVDLDQSIKREVPLEFDGTAKGVKLGGRLEVYRERLILSAKPQQIPRKVNVDISALDLNDNLRVSGIKLPEGVTAVYKQDFMILAVTSGKAADET